MATLDSMKAELKYAQSEYNRNQSLYHDGFISRAEMEKSQTVYEQAQQAVNKAQYAYERAVTNLGYATITSPVDGTVISRKVDKGQTVAASFQTPDLFEIAEDLSKMQIETAVSEADIGMIKDGMPVTFTVDAYPNMVFKGNVVIEKSIVPDRSFCSKVLQLPSMIFISISGYFDLYAGSR